MSADISPVGEKGESEDDGEDGPKITTDEITPYCSWWVVTAKCNSGHRKHIPFAVLEKSDEDPNGSEDDLSARPLCDNDRDVSWILKNHAVLPPGWVEDDRICEFCADRFHGSDYTLKNEEVSEDAE